MLAHDSKFLTVQGRRIEYTRIPGSPCIVFLHEGLGSLALWKDFPARLAQAAGCGALIYSRYGYGQSDPLAGPRGVNFMHDEALKSLPDLLAELHIDRPILFGHSDGGSIALIHAAEYPVRAVIALAPHVFVEDFSIDSIEAAKVTYETTDLREKLARYHADPDSAFRGWNDIWLHPDFRAWNIEEYLPRIHCPVLAIQGYEDEYGTMEQIDRMERAIPQLETLKLHNCGHSPHRDQPAAVIERTVRFLIDSANGKSGPS